MENVTSDSSKDQSYEAVRTRDLEWASGVTLDPNTTIIKIDKDEQGNRTEQSLKSATLRPGSGPRPRERVRKIHSKDGGSLVEITDYGTVKALVNNTSISRHHARRRLDDGKRTEEDRGLFVLIRTDEDGNPLSDEMAKTQKDFLAQCSGSDAETVQRQVEVPTPSRAAGQRGTKETRPLLPVGASPGPGYTTRPRQTAASGLSRREKYEQDVRFTQGRDFFSSAPGRFPRPAATRHDNLSGSSITAMSPAVQSGFLAQASPQAQGPESTRARQKGGADISFDWPTELSNPPFEPDAWEGSGQGTGDWMDTDSSEESTPERPERGEMPTSSQLCHDEGALGKADTDTVDVPELSF